MPDLTDNTTTLLGHSVMDISMGIWSIKESHGNRNLKSKFPIQKGLGM